MTVGLIQSPNDVYRSEIGTPAADGNRNLSATELATEFAYTFTGTTPTDELLTQAESGAQMDGVGLATKLLATDAGKLTLQQFFEAYTGYPQVASVERSNVANFAALRNDMVQETRAFIDQVVIQGNGGLKDLLTASTTNPSRSLATYYGFPAIKVASNARAFVTAGREPGSFVLLIDEESKAVLIETDPDTFWQTPHYVGWPSLLVRYGSADLARVRAMIGRARDQAAARKQARPAKRR